MEITLNIYTSRALREVEKTYTTNEFALSFGACEDVLAVVNLDLFEGGIQALSDESKSVEIIKIVVSAFPIFKDILKNVFDGLTDDEIGRTKIADIAKIVVEIVKYSFGSLVGSIGTKPKN